MAVPDSASAPAASLSGNGAPVTGAHSAFAIRMLILFLLLEYVRPPVLAEFRLQMVIIVVMLVLWFQGRNRPWSGILTSQVLFFLLCLQAIPFASNNYAAYFTTRIMFGHVVIALALAWLLATRSTFRTVTWAWLLIMGYVALYGITHGGTGPGAMLGDENDLALGCATAFPFAFYGFEKLSGWRRWLSGAICGLMVVAIVVSYSRGGFVATHPGTYELTKNVTDRSILRRAADDDVQDGRGSSRRQAVPLERRKEHVEGQPDSWSRRRKFPVSGRAISANEFRQAAVPPARLVRRGHALRLLPSARRAGLGRDPAPGLHSVGPFSDAA